MIFSSCSSSRAQSLDSLASNEDSFKTSTSVDINSGSVFALMAVRGINQELAANIVDYRERRGPYSNLEDLLKVCVNQCNSLDLTFRLIHLCSSILVLLPLM